MQPGKTPSFGGGGLEPKKIAALAVIFLVGIGGAVGSYYYMYEAPADEQEIALQTGIDSAFFTAPAEPKKEEAPEPPAPVQSAPKKPAKAVHAAPPSPPPPPPSDVFSGTPERDRAHIALFNAMRAASDRPAGISETAETARNGFTRKDGHFAVPTDRASDSVFLNRVITADRMIPALLINEVISDIGGQITAQIEEDIYGFHGREILIPRGSRAIGRYVPLSRIGDERLMATWDRIITPEGVNINLKDAQLADTMGRIGGYGEIDRRLSERYGLSILLSSITAVLGWSMNNQSSDPTTAAAANTYTTGLAEVTGQILREQINTQPRLTMPAGSRIFINPVQDIYFPPASSGTVLPSPFYKGDIQ